MMRNRAIARVVASFTLAFIVSAGVAQAQSERLSELEPHLRRVPGRLSQSLSRLREAGWVLTPSVNFASKRIARQTKGVETCRRGRRALFGALIGTAAAAPLAAVAHKRWENEAANGAAAAATTLALGAAGGAFIGLATCGS
jgi:hypothetical protein